MSEEEVITTDEENEDHDDDDGVSRSSIRESVGSSFKRRSVPSENVTLEETDGSSEAEETDDDGDGDGDGEQNNGSSSDEVAKSLEKSIIIAPKRKKRKIIILSDSEDDEDEEDVERVALSPRSRMSITGIRPADLSDDSSEIEYSDARQSSHSKSESNSKSLNDDSDSADETFNRSKKNSFLEQSAAENSKKDSSMEQFDQQEMDSPPHDDVSADGKQTSPTFFPRYSTHFAQNIQEKLSSTIYQPASEPINEDTASSSGSDVLIISYQKDKTIELFSSDNEGSDNEVKVIENAPQDLFKTKSNKNFAQPKISHVSQPSVSKTPKSRRKTTYVSQDFYRKEVCKLDEIRLELQSAEKLIDKIGHNLPDGGTQLKLRCNRLRSDIAIKTNYIESLKIEDLPGTSGMPLQEQKPKPKQLNRKPFFNQNTPDWEELSAAVNQIQPTHTGAKGLKTFNTQKTLTIDRLKEMHSSLEKRPTEDILAEDPQGLKIALMPHQKHALAWMTWREKQKPHGGILADDMGLGKTLTMISMVLAAKNCENDEDPDAKKESESEDDEKENQGWTAKGRRDYYNGGTLVVCPASLIRQWENEVESKVKRHRLTVCVHHGNNREAKPKHLRTYDIVVTTYNIVAREHKTNGTLFGLKWRRIILDEAHVVRNHKSLSSVAVCGLKGRYRWALTGTPIQNKETDVYALMKFLRCSPFDDLQHWKKWIDNKSAGGQMRLNTLLQSLMLRRTKAILQSKGELACLPEKEIKLIEVNLDKDEMNVYQKIMIYSRTLFAQFLMQRAEKNSNLDYREEGSRPTFMQAKGPNDAYFKMHKKFTRIYHGKKEVKSHEILVLLLRLRQICCHPGLIDAMLEDVDAQNMHSDSDTSQPEIDLLEQLNKLAIKDKSANIHNVSLENNSMGDDEPVRPEEQVMAKASARVLQRNNPVFDLRRPSSKMIQVLKTIKRNVLNTDDKAIIVSQWTSVLNILKTHLAEQGVNTLSLNGQIPVKNRQEIVTEFNNPQSNKKILLLSLTAGGVGLNLVGANHLLMIDLHWNPQLEAQAQDRIYRVGQKKNVIIYKFMCKDTVEERIKGLQDYKLQIANGVLTGAKGSEGSKLTIDDLKGLFGM